MNLRDRVESAIRAWNAYETGRGAGSVIDYDIYPVADEIKPALNRVAALRELVSLASEAEQGGSKVLAERVRADIAYLRTLLGAQPDLNGYILATQGCPAAGWPADYVESVGSRAREALNVIDIDWGRRPLRISKKPKGSSTSRTLGKRSATRRENSSRG